MTWICWRGIELSARVQQFLLAAEIAVLAAFAIVAIVKVYANDPAGSVHIGADWFNPFSLSVKALVDGLLLGIFIYWGWDSGVAVNEETESSAEAPGRAAVLSTMILLGIYLIVSAAAQAYAGTGLLIDNQNDVLRVLGTKVFGSPWDKLLIIAVLTSASASTQTTILPTARTALSMARWKAVPPIIGRIHPRYLSPDVATLGMGALSIIFTLVLVGFNSSQDVLGDSITALGFSILFYYGLTGLACVIYFRRELVKSWQNFVMAGVVPFVGFVVMAGIFVKAFIDYSKPDAGYAAPLFGIQVPIVIGIGGLLLGVPLMLLCALKYKEFFGRKLEVAADGSLDVELEHVERRSGLAVVDAVRPAVVGQLVEERLGREGFRAEHAGAAPGAVGDQLERDDRVQRGLEHDRLRPVLAHRPLVVDDVVEVGAPRLPVLAGARDVRAGAGAAASSGRRASPGSAAPRRRRPAARPSRPRTSTGAVESSPSLCSAFSTPMNSSPRPYLNVTRRQSTQRGTSTTSSCSTLTHSIGPMPSGKSKISGSENGSVVNQPALALPDERRVEALLDRRPDRERRREVVPGDDEIGAVANAHLVDLREEPVGGVAGEDVREAGLDADPDEREQPRLLPPRRRPRTALRRAARPAARRAAPDGARRASSPCRGTCTRRRTPPGRSAG